MKIDLSQIPEEFLREEFIRPAAGPGGQHVNRTANGVRLHFLFRLCPLLSDDGKERLAKKAAPYLQNDEIILCVHDSRSLQQNRREARSRLESLLEASCRAPKVRRPTKPTKASRERRLASKARRSDVKRGRTKITGE